MEVINNFNYLIKNLLCEIETYVTVLKWPHTCNYLHGPKGKPAVAILQKEHDNKIIPYDI